MERNVSRRTGSVAAWVSPHIGTVMLLLVIAVIALMAYTGTIGKPETVTAVATSALALGVAVAWIQIRADHDRSRRQNAIDYGAAWVRAQSRELTNAVRIASGLDQAVAQALFEYPKILSYAKPNPIVIDEKLRPHLAAIFDDFATGSGPVELDDIKALELRRLLIAYLNELEIVLSAWRHNVVDAEMIEEQFRFVMGMGHEFIAQEFFVVAGNSNFEGISRFVTAMRKKAEAQRGKGPAA